MCFGGAIVRTSVPFLLIFFSKASMPVNKYIWYSLFSLPVILIVISLTLLLIPNPRIASIIGFELIELMRCSYNEFAKQWINTGISVISSTQFNITSSSLSQKFKPITQVDGFYYPFRDKCNEKGDPECLITPAFFYDSSIVVDKFYPTHSVVTDGGQFVLNDTFVFSRVLVFSPLGLHCNTVRYLFMYCSM